METVDQPFSNAGWNTSDTKYRDIADGNPVPQLKEKSQHVTLKTKYRDIAATNQLPREKFLHVRQFSRTMTD